MSCQSCQFDNLGCSLQWWRATDLDLACCFVREETLWATSKPERHVHYEGDWGLGNVLPINLAEDTNKLKNHCRGRARGMDEFCPEVLGVLDIFECHELSDPILKTEQRVCSISEYHTSVPSWEICWKLGCSWLWSLRFSGSNAVSVLVVKQWTSFLLLQGS